MSLRIALVTTDADALPCPDRDTEPLLAALREAGADASVQRWRDPSVNWDGFDLLLVRSPWDYPDHVDQWQAWLGARDPSRVANSPAILHWNVDKAYLLQLAERGVPIIPTWVCANLAEVQAAVSATDSEQIVIKPTISAASRRTDLLFHNDPTLADRASEILSEGKRVVVEPAVPELASVGEHAVFIVEGRYSHAAHKGPLLALGGGLRGDGYIETMTAAKASAAEIEIAERTVATITEIIGETPLYARIDVVDTAAWGPVVIEAELFEPQYFFRLAPGAVERVAQAVIARAQHVRATHREDQS